MAVIVPVAGVTGVPVIVYVNCVGFITVTVNVPLYSGWSAPAIVTLIPVCSVAVDVTVAVAVDPDLVKELTA